MSTGIDPEGFFIDGNDNPVPAADVVERDARESRSNLVFDNAAWEIRQHTSYCLQSLYHGVRSIMERAEKKARLNRVRACLKPALEFDTSLLDRPDMAEFGCSPSYIPEGPDHAVEVQPDVDPKKVPIRSAGYHIHQSIHVYDESLGDAIVASTKDKKRAQEHVTRRRRISAVAMADIVLGTLDVIFTAFDAEAAKARRQTLGYGRAGEFRPRPFGVEYRTLSPWPLSAPVWTWYVCSTMRDVASHTSHDDRLEFLSHFSRPRVVRAINEHDVAEAVHIWLKAFDLVTDGRRRTYGRGSKGNDGLHPDLMRRVLFAIVNDGYRTYTRDWGAFWAWRVNTTEPWYAEKYSRFDGEIGYCTKGGSTNRERYFPSGTRRFLEGSLPPHFTYKSPDKVPTDPIEVLDAMGR